MIILLFGVMLADCLTSSTAQNTWIQKANFGGIPRHGAVGFSIGSKGYIGTGIGTGEIYTNDFWQYNPTTNAWTQKANFGGTAREAAVGFSIDTKGYIGTGQSGSFPNYIYYNDFWEYDPSTNTWTQKADFGGISRYWATGFSIGNKGYIGTGAPSSGGLIDDFWEYNPATNVWTQKANVGGTGRYAAVGFSIDNKGYVGTGYSYNGSPLTNDFWEYHPFANTWTQKADFGGTPRYFATGFSIGSKGYIGTGIDENDFWEYDPSNNIWTQKANFGGGVSYMVASFSISGKGYIGTGVYTTNELWEYTPTGCNGLTIYVDSDDDGFGDATNSLFSGDCTVPEGYVTNGNDCNDANVSVHPGVTDVCNGIDDNCNGITDEGCANAITTGSISGSPFCPEAILNVPFTSLGTFNAGNLYTAQLSDKKGNFSTPTLIGSLSSTANSGTIPATLPSNPTAGTKYRIRVTSSNPIVTGTNNGSNLELLKCRIVTVLSASGMSATAATLNWTGVFCAVKYKVQYRKQGISSWTTKYSITNSYTITGLVANTVYEYRVQTYCSESGSAKSGFTAVQTFTTTLRVASGSGSEEERMSIYPNPAEDQTIIHFTLQQSSHVSIKVYEINGREIETLLNDDVEQGDHSLLLNTDHFSKGVYLVKMISDSGIVNQKLIVQ